MSGWRRECYHENLLVICDQQVFVRVRVLSANGIPNQNLHREYEETIINDAVPPHPVRVGCETCGMELKLDSELKDLASVKTDKWTWTLASKMEFAAHVRRLRHIVKELSGRS